MKIRTCSALVIGLGLGMYGVLGCGQALTSGARIWVTTDLSDPADPNHRDLDDIVTTSVMLFFANEFRILGFTTDVTDLTSCSGYNYTLDTILPAYGATYSKLSQLGTYPTESTLAGRTYQGACKVNFNPNNPYTSVRTSTTKLVEAAVAGKLYALNWGGLTELAIAVKHATTTNKTLSNLVIVSHATMGSMNNALRDISARDFLINQAKQRKISFYELGDQNYSINNRLGKCPNGGTMNKAVKTSSQLGALMGLKWGNGYPDFSDGSTYLFVLGYGGGLASIPVVAGKYFELNGYTALCNDRPNYKSEIERRALFKQALVRDALLVVGNKAALTATDNSIKNRLTSNLGFTVTLASDQDAVPSTSGLDLVFLAESSAGATLGSKYKSVMVPVVASDPVLFNLMGFVAASSGRGKVAATQGTITNSASPLVAGLTSPVAVYSATANMNFALTSALAPTADQAMQAVPGKTVLFGYDSGATMAAGTAAHRRVGFFLNNGAQLTTGGWKLFDNAVNWAAGL